MSDNYREGYFDVVVRSDREFFRVYWTDTVIPDTNKSQVVVSVRYYSRWKTESSQRKSMSLWVDGERYDFSGYIGVKGWSDDLKVVRDTLTHDSEGDRTCKIRFAGEVKIRYSGKWYDRVDSGYRTINLTQIKSLPSYIRFPTRNTAVGKRFNYEIVRKNSKAKHTLQLKVGDYTKTILDKDSQYGESYFNIPTEPNIYSHLTSAITTGYLELETYIDGRYIGKDKERVNIGLSDDDLPKLNPSTSVSVTVSPLSEITTAFIKGKSRAFVQIKEISIPQGAYIRQYNIRLNGRTISTNEMMATTPVLTTSGENWISVDVVDSRGNISNTINKSFIVLEYSKPIIKSVSILRHDGNKVNEKGTKLFIVADGKIDEYIPDNNITVKVYIKKQSETDYGEPIYTQTKANDMQLLHLTEKDYPASYTYVVKITVSDKFDNVVVYEKVIKTEKVLCDISPYGIAIGKVFEGDNETVQVGHKTIFYGDVEFRAGVVGVTTDITHIPENLNNAIQLIEAMKLSDETKSKYEEIKNMMQ